jgi:hypothetical protein
MGGWEEVRSQAARFFTPSSSLPLPLQYEVCLYTPPNNLTCT